MHRQTTVLGWLTASKWRCQLIIATIVFAILGLASYAHGQAASDRPTYYGIGWVQDPELLLSELHEAAMEPMVIDAYWPQSGALSPFVPPEGLDPVHCTIIYVGPVGARTYFVYAQSAAGQQKAMTGYRLMRHTVIGNVNRLVDLYTFGSIYSAGHRRIINDRDTIAAGTCLMYMLFRADHFGIEDLRPRIHGPEESP